MIVGLPTALARARTAAWARLRHGLLRRGVCCDTACGGGDPTDCQVCSIARRFLERRLHGLDGERCDDGDACTQPTLPERFVHGSSR